MSRRFTVGNTLDNDAILDNILLLEKKVEDMSESQESIRNSLEKIAEQQRKDHDELVRVLANRDFFWSIIVKAMVPVMLAVFTFGMMMPPQISENIKNVVKHVAFLVQSNFA